MDNFIVSARKYRPETFSSVVGQGSITGTLKSAIKKKQLGHAYLFCGPRGVGKTTCARIFAKTINCMSPVDGAEPCNTCESCQAFNESRSFNIHELDAASNNSVDDMRNLIDQVRIPPQLGKYSIYIIDEVHMLSAQAFNTFLKTLEEPPAHAVFILATTEKHKIIPTILSRCQIFDFNRIGVEDIVKYLEYISKQEGIEYEPDAFNIIALKADGAMRDALSIYDQMVSFSGQTIRYKAVIDNLNILDYDYFFRMTSLCLEGDTGGTLVVFDEILAKGFDAHNFLAGFSSHMRDLLVCQDEATLKLLEVGAGIRDRYAAQAKEVDQQWLFRVLDILGSADVSFKSARNQRLHIELALLKISRLREDAKKKAPAGSSESVAIDKSEPGAKPGTAGDITQEPAAKADTSEVESREPEPKSGTSPDAAPEPEPKSGPAEDVPAQAGADGTEEPAVDRDGPGSTPVDADVNLQRRPVRPGNMPSIKDAINGTQKKQEDEVLQEKVEKAVLNDPFTQEDLLAHWEAYTESIRSEKPRMANSLKHHLPSLEDALQIELVLSNTAQLEEFNRDIKPELVSYLEKALNNNQFKILPVITESEDQKSTLYTSEEKFEHMKKKNPDLGKLKERFNLDFE